MSLIGAEIHGNLYDGGSAANLGEFLGTHLCERIVQHGPRVKVNDIVRGSGMARKTFYERFGGRDKAVRDAFLWAGDNMLTELRCGGVAALIHFARQNPALAKVVALHGRAIDIARYEGYLDLAAEIVNRPNARGVVGGVLSVVARVLDEGRELDDELIDRLGYFATAATSVEAVAF